MIYFLFPLNRKLLLSLKDVVLQVFSNRSTTYYQVILHVKRWKNCQHGEKRGLKILPMSFIDGLIHKNVIANWNIQIPIEMIIVLYVLACLYYNCIVLLFYLKKKKKNFARIYMYNFFNHLFFVSILHEIYFTSYFHSIK